MGDNKRRKGDLDKDYRINIKLLTREELAIYRQIKARADLEGVTMRDFVLSLMRREVTN